MRKDWCVLIILVERVTSLICSRDGTPKLSPCLRSRKALWAFLVDDDCPLCLGHATAKAISQGCFLGKYRVSGRSYMPWLKNDVPGCSNALRPRSDFARVVHAVVFVARLEYRRNAVSTVAFSLMVYFSVDTKGGSGI
jgi:hypothetical protein